MNNTLLILEGQESSSLISGMYDEACKSKKKKKMEEGMGVPEQHQKKIALSTLKMSEAGAKISGGMSHKDAYLFMLNKAGWNDKKIQDYMRKAGWNYEEIQNLMKKIHLESEDFDEDELSESEMIINKIRKMVDRNDHTNAMAVGAKMLGNLKLEKIFKAISSIQDIEGYLPHNLSLYRYDKLQDMYKEAEKRLDQEDYELFYSAY